MLFMDRTESLKPSIVKQSSVYKCTERKKKTNKLKQIRKESCIKTAHMHVQQE